MRNLLRLQLPHEPSLPAPRLYLLLRLFRLGIATCIADRKRAVQHYAQAAEAAVAACELRQRAEHHVEALESCQSSMTARLTLRATGAQDSALDDGHWTTLTQRHSELDATWRTRTAPLAASMAAWDVQLQVRLRELPA